MKGIDSVCRFFFLIWVVFIQSISSVQWLICVWLSATPWTAAQQASLSITNFQSLLKVKVKSEVTQSCPTLGDPMGYGLPHSSVHGIFQARVLEWVAISFSRGSFQPRDWTQVSWIVGRYFTVWATRKVQGLSLLKLMSIELVMPSNRLIFCHPLLLLPSIFPSISVFFNESVLHIRWSKFGVSASSSVLPMNIQEWFPLGFTDLISLQFKGLSRVFSNTTVQKHQFFGAQLSLDQLSHPYMTTRKTIALTKWTFIDKVISLLFNMLSSLVIAFLPRSMHFLGSWLQWFCK